MLEFLQRLVAALAGALPTIVEKKERDASAELGAELFLVYVECNQALVLGEDIVRCLETYVERMSDHLRTGKDSYALTAGDWISDKVHQQVRNLGGIADRIRQWRRELQILDGRSVNELRFLLALKVSALTALAEATGEQRVPLRTDGILIDDRGVLHTDHRGISGHPDISEYQRLHDELLENSVRMDEPWGPETLAVVKKYLELRKPREQLDEIRNSLEKLREALQANFTVSDVLLRVGDQRFGNRGRYR